MKGWVPPSSRAMYEAATRVRCRVSRGERAQAGRSKQDPPRARLTKSKEQALSRTLEPSKEILCPLGAAKGLLPGALDAPNGKSKGAARQASLRMSD